MKRIIVTGAVAAIAAVSFAGTANAAPVPGTPQCFGQVHKAVNTANLVPGADNVGELLKALNATGQGKKALVKGDICVPTPPAS